MPRLILISIYTIELLIAAFYFFRSNSSERIENIYKSGDIFFIFFILIHIFMPFLQELVVFYRYQPSYSIQTSLVTNIVAILALIVFLLLLNAFKVFDDGIQYPKKARTIKNHSYFFILLVALIGLYASISNFKNILSYGWVRYFSDRIAYGEGKGVILLLAHHIYMIALFLFIQWYKKRSRKLFFLFFGFLLWVLTYYTVTGNRNSIFIFLVSLVITWLIISKKKLKFKPAKFFFLALIISTAFVVGGIMREGTDDNLDTGRALVWGLNGAFGNHENIQWLYEHEYKLQMGETYLASILNFVPRKIWPNKPFGAGPRLKNMIHPGTYIYGTAGNSSLTTGLVTEAIMNFGFIFYLVVIIIWAFLLVGLFSISKYIRTDLDILIYVYTFVFASFIVIYAEFMGLLSRYLFVIFPYVLIALFDRVIIKEYVVSSK